MTSGITALAASFIAECRKCRLVAIDHHNARAPAANIAFGATASQSDARRSPGHGGNPCLPALSPSVFTLLRPLPRRTV